ncbi:MAG: hypothetical protein CME06_02820 [Gemmatimonadetes bacterium]|nr:hypothetical protein [Gemmatimonadota bacterium]
MNNFDIVSLVIVVLAALLGLRKGFAIRLVGLASLAAGIVTFLVARAQIAAALESVVGSDSIAGLVAVPLSFLLGSVPVSLVGRFLVRAARATPLRLVDALLGGVVGIAQGVLIVVLVLLPVCLIVPSLRPALEESRAYAAATSESAPWRAALADLDTGRKKARDFGGRAAGAIGDIDFGEAAERAQDAISAARESLPEPEEIQEAAEELRERVDGEED